MQPQPAAAPHLDHIAKRSLLDNLSHRPATEHQALHTEKPCTLGKLDPQVPAYGTAIEQNGLLGQPLGRAAIRHGNPRSH